MFYKALNKKLVCTPPLTTAYLPTDLLNLPIHSAYKVWHHLVIFNKHHLHPSFASLHCFGSKPDASICLVTYPTKSFRRTNDLALAKAVMYCKGHKASFSACCVCTRVSVSFSFAGLRRGNAEFFSKCSCSTILN